MPKRVNGVPTTIKRKIKFLKVENETLTAVSKTNEVLIKTVFVSDQGLELMKMFANKSFIKINKDLTIKAR